jgi:hypothetical protein
MPDTSVPPLGERRARNFKPGEGTVGSSQEALAEQIDRDAVNRVKAVARECDRMILHYDGLDVVERNARFGARRGQADFVDSRQVGKSVLGGAEELGGWGVGNWHAALVGVHHLYRNHSLSQRHSNRHGDLKCGGSFRGRRQRTVIMRSRGRGDEEVDHRPIGKTSARDLKGVAHYDFGGSALIVGPANPMWALNNRIATATGTTRARGKLRATELRP